MPADRFSLLYLQRGAPNEDSARARKRVASRLWVLRKEMEGEDPFVARLVRTINAELGVEVPSKYGYDLHEFFDKCELRDFLDSITLILNILSGSPRWGMHVSPFREFVARVFAEENLSYALNGEGTVRYRVDEEFALNISSAIAAVSSPKYVQVQAAFARACDDFSQPSPDALGALRNLFEAAESLFKTVTGTNRALDDGEVRKTLLPFVDQRMKDADSIAKSSAARLAQGFSDWVQAVHPYRHGHDQPAPVVPPLPLAIALVSSGAAYIRWIAALNE